MAELLLPVPGLYLLGQGTGPGWGRGWEAKGEGLLFPVAFLEEKLQTSGALRSQPFYLIWNGEEQVQFTLFFSRNTKRQASMVFRLFKEFTNITYSLLCPSSVQSLSWNNSG